MERCRRVCSTYSSQLLSTDIRSDAPHEQGGGEVEGAGLRGPRLLSLLLALLVSLAPFCKAHASIRVSAGLHQRMLIFNTF